MSAIDIDAVKDCWNEHAPRHKVRVLDAGTRRRIAAAIKGLGGLDLVRQGIVHYCNHCKHPGSWQAKAGKSKTLGTFMSQTGQTLGVAHWINESPVEAKAHAERKARTAPALTKGIGDIPENEQSRKEKRARLWDTRLAKSECHKWYELSLSDLAERFPGQAFPPGVVWANARRLFIEAKDEAAQPNL